MFAFRVIMRVFVVMGIILAALIAYEFGYRYPLWTMRAFRVPSESMCPTICNGERILVEMQDGNPYVPKAGDVIVFEYGPGRQKFIKRVIGLPGDTVAPGPGNTILVNGRAWIAPSVCVKSLRAKATDDGESEVTFPETHMPTGQTFVIGDNLNHSFDSRIAEFEPVTLDKVIGKPVLIYFSPSGSRIGCPVR